LPLAELGRDGEMTMGPREALAPDGQASEFKLPLGSGALCNELPQELLFIIKETGLRSNQRALARIGPRFWSYPKALVTIAKRV
jgi:hypothetical protein